MRFRVSLGTVFSIVCLSIGWSGRGTICPTTSGYIVMGWRRTSLFCWRRMIRLQRCFRRASRPPSERPRVISCRHRRQVCRPRQRPAGGRLLCPRRPRPCQVCLLRPPLGVNAARLSVCGRARGDVCVVFRSRVLCWSQHGSVACVYVFCFQCLCAFVSFRMVCSISVSKCNVMGVVTRVSRC